MNSLLDDNAQAACNTDINSARHTSRPGFSGSRWAARLTSAATLGFAALLYGCGGGGGDSGGTGTTPPPAASVTLQGTAATGAPFRDAVVTVSDRSGAAVGTSAAVAADGSYSVSLNSGATPPFVLTATRDDQSLVSVSDGTQTTVNITPITHLIASRLSASGDPTKLAREVAAGTATVDATRIASRKAEVISLIQPLRDALGDATDPLNGTFKADGTGADRLLDSLLVTIVPDSATSANIQVSVKQGTTTPNVVAFNSTQAPPAALAPVQASTLVTPGISALITDLLDRMTACWALPVGTRATGTTAASVAAPECRSLFLNNDPTTYLSNGVRVGSTGAFTGIFNPGSTGVKFSRGAYEFSRANGDVVLSYTASGTSGASDTGTFIARPVTDASGRTTLKQVGNQYVYPGAVVPFHQLRRFPVLNQSGSDYHSSGYVIAVDNAVDGNGQPIFDRVEVVTPSGSTLTLKPSAGGGALNFAYGNGTVSGTNFLRLARAYADAARTDDPAARDTSLFFSSQRFTDAEMARVPEQSVWTLRYYLASAPSAVAATQSYRTLRRALTLAELRTKGLANLTAGSLGALQALADPVSGSLRPLPAAGPLVLSWEVPAGALAPTAARLYGRDGNAGFNDSVSVASTARSASIACSRQTSNDVHCSGTGFAPTTVGTAVDLHVRDLAGREYTTLYAAYRLN